MDQISKLIIKGGRKGLALASSSITSTSNSHNLFSRGGYADGTPDNDDPANAAASTSSSLPPWETPPPGFTIGQPPPQGVHWPGILGPTRVVTPQLIQFWRQLYFDKDYNRIYWYFLAVILGLFVLRRVVLALLLLRKGSVISSSPAMRYVSEYAQGGTRAPPVPSWIAAIELFGNKTFRRPTWGWANWLSAGKMASIVVLVAWNFAFLFPKSLPSHFPNGPDGSYIEFIGVRISSTAVQNLPLIYALSGRNNIVSFLTAVPSTGLRFFHKMTGIFVFFLCFVHAILMTVQAAQYGYEAYKIALSEDLYKHGILTMCGVSIMFFFSLPPMRTYLYEIFLSTHYAGSAILLAGLYFHQPRRRAWVYVCIAFWGLDHFIRLLQIFRNHVVLPLLYKKKLPPGSHMGELGRIDGRVEMVPGAILLSIPYLGSWGPGQHFYLSFADEAWGGKWWRWFEGHPWTVSSLPTPIPAPHDPSIEEGSSLIHEMRFIIREKKGLTKDLHRIVEARGLSPEGTSWPMGIKLIVDGPYGSSTRTEGFERVMLFAGGSGVTHIFSMLLKLIERCRDRTQGETRRVDFIWAIQGLEHMRWVSEHLNNAIRSLPPACPIDFSILIYVTRPNALDARRLSLPPNTYTDSSAPSSDHGHHGPLLGSGSEPGGAWPSTRVNLAPAYRTLPGRETTQSSFDALTESKTPYDNEAGKTSPTDTYRYPPPPPPVVSATYHTYGEESAPHTTDPSTGRPNSGRAFLSKSEKPSNPWQAQVSGISKEVEQITTIQPGRPPALELVEEAVTQTMGGVLVVACGSDGLAIEVETAVARASRPSQALKGGQKGRGFVKAEIARFVA